MFKRAQMRPFESDLVDALICVDKEMKIKPRNVEIRSREPMEAIKKGVACLISVPGSI